MLRHTAHVDKLTQVPIHLLSCRRCAHVCMAADNVTWDYQISSKFTCTCPSCKLIWIVCSLHQQRFGNRRMAAAQRHFTNVCHDVVSTSADMHVNDDALFDMETPVDATTNFTDNDGCKASIDAYEEDNGPDPSTHDGVTDILKDRTCADCKQPADLSFSNMPKKSTRFYQDELVSTGNGIRGLVGRAFTKRNNSSALASANEAELQLEIAQFSNSLTSSQVHRFTNIMHKVQQEGMFTHTRTPMHVNESNQFHLKGYASVLQNVPCPTAFSLDQHACISLTSTIDHFLASGIIHDGIGNHTFLQTDTLKANPLHNTVAMKQIVYEVSQGTDDNVTPLVPYLTFFSDDFEVNRTKKNCNSTWILTVTISPPIGFSTSVK
jgi:hypothetical protein